MENYGTNRMGGGHKLLQDRLKTEIETLKGISEPCRCGTTRQSYSAAYKEGTAYIKGVMEDCGLTVHEDGVGNVIGTLTGTEPGLAKILSGSHLDTVRCAGAFDGIAGVVCAAEAARLVRESGMPLRHTFQVLGMIGEEGTRFGKALLGSQFIAGIYGEEQLDEFIGIEDKKTMRQAMTEYGLSGDLKGVSRKEDAVKAFLEIHGEQGPVLEQEEKQIGVVDTIVGLSWLVVKVKGQAGHSGTVPMNLRRDAGTGAFHLICRIHDYVCDMYSGRATLTAGQVSLLPGSMNSIPGECEFSLDIRSGEEEILRDILEHLTEFAGEVREKYALDVEVRELTRKEPVKMNAALAGGIEDVCKELGFTSMRLNSGAGHDSMIFAKLWDTAMIFLPNRDGISHHPDEWIDYEAMAAGSRVLYQMIRKLDEED